MRAGMGDAVAALALRRGVPGARPGRLPLRILAAGVR